MEKWNKIKLKKNDFMNGIEFMINIAKYARTVNGMATYTTHSYKYMFALLHFIIRVP